MCAATSSYLIGHGRDAPAVTCSADYLTDGCAIHVATVTAPFSANGLCFLTHCRAASVAVCHDNCVGVGRDARMTPYYASDDAF